MNKKIIQPVEAGLESGLETKLKPKAKLRRGETCGWRRPNSLSSSTTRFLELGGKGGWVRFVIE